MKASVLLLIASSLRRSVAFLPSWQPTYRVRRISHRRATIPGDGDTLSDDQENQPERLEDALRSLINISSGALQPDKDDSIIQNELSTEQVKELLAKLESVVVENEGPEALEGDDDDGPYLDEEAYTNFLNNLNSDGSLTLDRRNDSMRNGVATTQRIQGWVDPKPELPESYYNSNTDATLEDLFQARLPGPDLMDENVHQQIMAEEQGFQKQSELFQQYLGEEVDGEDTIMKMREERRFAAQREVLLKLEAEMKELDDTLETAANDLNVSVCSKCKCPLSQQEIDIGPKYYKGMCRLCFGDQVAETSDMKFLNAPPIGNLPYDKKRSSSTYVPFVRQVDAPPRRRDAYNGVTDFWSNDLSANKTTATMNTKSDAMEHNSPQRHGSSSSAAPSAASPAETAPTRQVAAVRPKPSQLESSNEIVQLKRRITALHQQVERYKRQAEVAERKARATESENIRLQRRVLELEEATESETETSKSVWMKVYDPDTSETFYWNEDTEEMKWELDEGDEVVTSDD